jgi:hypothetical protein
VRSRYWLEGIGIAFVDGISYLFLKHRMVFDAAASHVNVWIHVEVLAREGVVVVGVAEAVVVKPGREGTAVNEE